MSRGQAAGGRAGSLAGRRGHGRGRGRPSGPKTRRHGKSDAIDAEAAARAVQSGRATAIPKTGDGPVEMIRVLRLTRRSAVKNRTMAANQLAALVITAPVDTREQLRGLNTVKLVARVAKFRCGDEPDTGVDATRYALRELSRSALPAPDRQIARLDVQLERLVTVTAPELVAKLGVGTQTAAALLVAAGDNPERLEDEGSFAHLTGTAPLDASLVRQAATSPAQPWRRPRRQLCAVSDRAHPPGCR